jgi:hypothetical protein
MPNARKTWKELRLGLNIHSFYSEMKARWGGEDCVVPRNRNKRSGLAFFELRFGN